MPSPFSARSKAFLGVVLCVGVWGVNYPATKIAYKELSPLAYTGWRFLIAAALILGWAVRNGAPVLPARGLRRYGLLLAMAGIGIYQPIFAIGVERTSGFAAALLNSVSPLLALLIVAALGIRADPSPRRRRDGGGLVRRRGIPRRGARVGGPRRAFREPPLPRVGDVLGHLQRLLFAPFEPDPACDGARDDLRVRHPGPPRLLRAVDGPAGVPRRLDPDVGHPRPFGGLPALRLLPALGARARRPRRRRHHPDRRPRPGRRGGLLSPLDGRALLRREARLGRGRPRRAGAGEDGEAGTERSKASVAPARRFRRGSAGRLRRGGTGRPRSGPGSGRPRPGDLGPGTGDLASRVPPDGARRPESPGRSSFSAPAPPKKATSPSASASADCCRNARVSVSSRSSSFERFESSKRTRFGILL